MLGEVSRGASSFEFSCHAAWNQSTCSDSQIGILLRETCAYAAPEESYDYECVLAERDVVSTSYLNAPDLGFVDGDEATVKFMLVFGNEYGTKGDQYSHKLRVNEQGHIEMCRAVKNKVLVLQNISYFMSLYRISAVHIVTTSKYVCKSRKT